MHGKVIDYGVDRGYGFIQGEDGHEYFVSYAHILDSDYRYLVRGQQVSFEPVRTVKGLQAHHVKPLDLNEEAKAAGKLWVAAKPNPFTPQDPIVDPMMFAGREEQIDLGLDAVVNSQNILVTGDRGVGKSSFSNQILTIASGDFTLLDQLVIPNPEADLQRLAVAYTCEPGDTLEVIAASVADAIESEAGSEKPSRTTTTLGVKKIVEASHAVEYVDDGAPSIAAAFANTVVDAIQAAAGMYDGVCILLDEVDVLNPKVPLAPFLKAAIETIRNRGVTNVNFIVTGVSGEITDLLRQHASVSRLFMNVHLDPMSERELKDIVVRALKGTDIGIHPKALDSLIAQSGCLPASVQLLGYYAYKTNSDTHIDTHDVDQAVAVVLRHIRKQFYRDMRERIETSGPHAVGLLGALAQYRQVAVLLAADTANCREDEARDWLEDMRRARVVTREGDKYALRDPLFWRFLSL